MAANSFAFSLFRGRSWWLTVLVIATAMLILPFVLKLTRLGPSGTSDTISALPGGTVSAAVLTTYTPIVTDLGDLGWLKDFYPPPTKSNPSMSYYLHTLRVYGVDGTFRQTDEGFLNCRQLLEVITNQEQGIIHFGVKHIRKTPFGIRFPTGGRGSTNSDNSLEAHRDQVLASLAELQIPLNHSIHLAGEVSSLAAALDDSIAGFDLKQRELEWTTIAYALYLPPRQSWTNRHGETYRFDDLATTLLSRNLDEASCGGVHALFALNVLYRVDAATKILSERESKLILDRLQETSAQVSRSQRPDGSWSRDWRSIDAASEDGRSVPERGEELLLVTGHLLEWLFYLPSEIQVSDAVYERAGRWLIEYLRQSNERQRLRNFCPYAHATCALIRLSEKSTTLPNSTNEPIRTQRTPR